MKHIHACIAELVGRDESGEDPRHTAISAIQAIMSVCASSFGTTLAANGVPRDQIEGLAETIGTDTARTFLGGATNPGPGLSLFGDERKRRAEGGSDE
jgi:hypothetical protein